MAFADAANIATSPGFRNRLVAALQQRAHEVLADSSSSYSALQLARQTALDGWVAADRLVWQVASHPTVLDQGVQDGEAKASDEQLAEAVASVWDSFSVIAHPEPEEEEPTQVRALREIADSIANTVKRRR